MRKGSRAKARMVSPAVSTLLLIMIAIGAVSAAAAFTHHASLVASKKIEVAVDAVSLSRARSGADIWIFSMNLRNTGSMPVEISGTVTGPSVEEAISHGILVPGSQGALSYVWAVAASPGEKYLVNFVVSGSDGSTKTYVISVQAGW